MDLRRQVKFETTPVTLGLDLLAAVLSVLPWAWVLFYWSRLPARVPANFGTGGHVNTWADRWTIWMIPFLSLIILTLLLTVVRRPTLYNVSVKLTPQNVHRQLYLARGFAYAMLLWSLILLAWVSWQQIHLALGEVPRFDEPFILVFVAVELAILVWYFTAAYRARGG